MASSDKGSTGIESCLKCPSMRTSLEEASGSITKVQILGTYLSLVWSGTRILQLHDDERIDTEILNDSIYVEILLETIPQVVIQVYNNMQISPDNVITEWSPISLFSLH